MCSLLTSNVSSQALFSAYVFDFSTISCVKAKHVNPWRNIQLISVRTLVSLTSSAQSLSCFVTLLLCDIEWPCGISNREYRRSKSLKRARRSWVARTRILRGGGRRSASLLACHRCASTIHFASSSIRPPNHEFPLLGVYVLSVLLLSSSMSVTLNTRSPPTRPGLLGPYRALDTEHHPSMQRVVWLFLHAVLASTRPIHSHKLLSHSPHFDV